MTIPPNPAGYMSKLRRIRPRTLQISFQNFAEVPRILQKHGATHENTASRTSLENPAGFIPKFRRIQSKAPAALQNVATCGF